MKEYKKEIMLHIVNSIIAGALVFFGALSSGNITFESICLSLSASIVVALTKFKEFWRELIKDNNRKKKSKRKKTFRIEIFSFL